MHYGALECLGESNFWSSSSTQQKMNNLFQVDEIVLNNILLPTLFWAVNNIEQYCYT